MLGHAQQHSAVSCAKMTEPIQMLFGLWMWILVGPRKHVLRGATWRIRLSRPCAAVMRPFCQITLDYLFIFTARRYASAVYAMTLSVCLSQVGVLSKPVIQHDANNVPRQPRDSAFLMPKTSNTRGIEKTCDFSQITRHMSKTTQERSIVSVKGEQNRKLYDLSQKWM